MARLPFSTLSLVALFLSGCISTGNSDARIPSVVDPYQLFVEGSPVSISGQSSCVERALSAAAMADRERMAAVQRDCEVNEEATSNPIYWRALASGAFAQGDYQASTQFSELGLETITDTGGPLSRPDLEGTLAMSRAWSDFNTRRVSESASGIVELTYDQLGLMRIPVDIDGETYSAMLDTGAGVSVISERLARQSGLEIRDDSLAATSSTAIVLDAKWTVIPRLAFGNVVIADVPLIVVPGQAMQLIEGYELDIVIGFPVLRALESICVSSDTISITPSSPDHLGTDIRFADNAIYSDVAVNGVNTSLFLDSGATGSSLSGKFLARHPSFSENGTRSQRTMAGAGGTRTEDIVVVRDVDLTAEGEMVTIATIDVATAFDPVTDADDRFGVIGLDILRQQNWALDMLTNTLSLNAQCHAQ